MSSVPIPVIVLPELVLATNIEGSRKVVYLLSLLYGETNIVIILN
jgi:hypothetical protein